MSSEKVVILGASDNPERYSYKAYKKLLEHGHEPFLVSPRLKSLEGREVYPSLEGLSGIDTVTVYVNPAISSGLQDDLINLKPKRVIFNPGSENLELMNELSLAGIAVEPACTLVLLSTGQY